MATPATISTPTVGDSSFIGQLIDLFHGVNGQPLDQANGYANVADPFRQERPQYQGMLKGLLTDPNTFAMDPGTQFAMKAGTDAITRAANAQGVTRGGSVVADIGQYVTGTAEKAYNDRINQLMTLSGATTGSPAAAAAALAQGQQNREGDLASGISGISGLLNSLFGGGSSAAGGALGVIQRLFGGGGGGDPFKGFNPGDYTGAGGGAGGPGDEETGGTGGYTFDDNGNVISPGGGGDFTIPDLTNFDGVGTIGDIEDTDWGSLLGDGGDFGFGGP